MTKAQYLAAMAKYKTKEDTFNENKFVQKVAGKGLSTEDYTTAEQTKLNGVETGAQVNVIESITVNNGQPLTVTSKGVNIDLSDYAKTSDIGSVYTYKGSVSTYALLPSTDLSAGDTYNIETADPTNGIKAGDNVAWTGSAWDVLSGTVDLSGYVQAEAGKGLSEVNVTAADKAKWDAAATGEDVTQSEINALFGENS